MTRLRDRLFAWRDGLVANARFQRWAAAFPLTRGIARRQSRDLFDLCAGFVYSQVLAACVELDLFSKLADGPRGAAELAPRLALSVEATTRLLRAATSLRLCATAGQAADGGPRYGLGLLGAAMLGNPAVAGMIAHHRLLYADLADPVALLRGEREATALSRFWPYAKGGDEGQDKSQDKSQDKGEGNGQDRTDGEGEAAGRYSALMSQSQALIVDDILEAYPFARHRVVLDVGGGDGTFLAALARHAPNLRLMLFDLPSVAARATARFAAAGLSGRAMAVGGNATRDSLPHGADLITLVRVLHDHDDDVALAILRGIHAALPPGGTLLIAEPMAGVRGAEPVGDAYFGFYLLAMGSGRARDLAEITALLAAAGFARVRPLRTRRPLTASAVVAHRA